MRKFIAILMTSAFAVLAMSCGSKEIENADQQPQDVTEIASVDDVAKNGEITLAEDTTQNNETAPSEDTSQNNESADSNNLGITEAQNGIEENEQNINGALPAYEYPGPEHFYSVLYQYVIDVFGAEFSREQVIIPCPVIAYIDDSDKSDIKVYGDFHVDNYYLDGDILKNVSGGSFPGCIHMKFTEAGYEALSVDVVQDGSNFTPSAKEIFGEHYDDFMKIYADQENREAIRAQIIANYVAANGLNITAYQDYGWDPVPLPEENIDTFYQ